MNELATLKQPFWTDNRKTTIKFMISFLSLVIITDALVLFSVLPKSFFTGCFSLFVTYFIMRPNRVKYLGNLKFTNSKDEIIKKSPKYLGVTIFIAAVVGIWSAAFFMDTFELAFGKSIITFFSDIIFSFMFTAYMASYFIYTDCPMTLVLDRHCWTASDPNNIRYCHSNSYINTSLYPHQKTITQKNMDPLYSYMPGNAYNRHR